MTDGTEVNLFKCSTCKLQMQDLNIPSMHSWTQASGTVPHIDFFMFCLISVFRDRYVTDFPNVDNVSLHIFLCSV